MNNALNATPVHRI